MPFVKGQSGNPKGRPKNENRQNKVPLELQSLVHEKLSEAVENGEQWAIVEVYKRMTPTLKPVESDQTPEHYFNAIKAYKSLKYLLDSSKDDGVINAPFLDIDDIQIKPPVKPAKTFYTFDCRDDTDATCFNCRDNVNCAWYQSTVLDVSTDKLKTITPVQILDLGYFEACEERERIEQCEAAKKTIDADFKKINYK